MMKMTLPFSMAYRVGVEWSELSGHKGEHCIVQAVLLPYETCKTTGKDIFLAHTHYTKGLQAMKCNQFCLCRVWHAVVNFCKFGTLRCKNNYFLSMHNSK